MRQGVYQAFQYGLKNIVIEGDNKIIIQVMWGEINIPWLLHTLIQNMQLLLRQVTEIQVLHIY